jgi:hypothetical protein
MGIFLNLSAFPLPFIKWINDCPKDNHQKDLNELIHVLAHGDLHNGLL